MKQKISITIDEDMVQDILKTISSGKFRNKSHVVEYALKKLLECRNCECAIHRDLIHEDNNSEHA